MRFVQLLFLLININTAKSQNDLIISKLEIDGLSSQDINFFFIDNRNFSWIGTDQGLNKNDGTLNQIFRSNPFDSTTLINNNVYNSFQINDNGTFFKSNGGLDFYNYKNYSFKRITAESKPIHHISLDDNIVFTTENKGVYKYNPLNETLDNFRFDPRNPLSISSSNFAENQNDILHVLQNDSNNVNLLIGTTYGLNYFNLNNKTSKRYYQNQSENTLSSNFIYDIFQLKKSKTISKEYEDNFLISTDKGLSILDLKTNKIKNLKFFEGKIVKDIFEFNSELFVHSENLILKIISLENGKIKTEKIYSNNSNFEIKKINDDELIVFSNENSYLNRIIANQNYKSVSVNIGDNIKINDVSNFKGAYYISTNSGVYKVNEKINNITILPEETYNSDNIIAVAENDYYRVIMTESELLIYEYEELIKSYNLKNDFRNQSFKNPALFLDEDEFLYFGSEKLNIIDLYTDEVITYENSKEGFNSIISGLINNISLMIRNEKKEIWVSLNNGISILDIESQKFENYKFNQRSKNKFPNGFSSLILTNKNEIWITNSLSGLYRYNAADLSLINHYIFDINNKNSITSSSLTSIIEYNDELYIGSDGEGVFVFENDSLGFKNINEEDGLLSNNILGFLKTYQHLFILSTKGINYFDFEIMSSLTDGDNNNLRNINSEDGLLEGEYLNNGITFYEDLLYLFSSNKIQKIDLYNLYIDREDPKVNLTKANVIDDNFEKSDYIIKNNNIDITDNISNIELILSTPSYYKAQSSQIFYKIEGISDKWISLSKGRNLVLQSSGYSNSFTDQNKILAPYGSYNLRIKSTNSSGLESTDQLLYQLNIIPPWYLTIYAIIAYIIIAASSIYFYVKFNQERTKKLMEDKRKEEELEEAHNLQMGLLAKEKPKRDDLDISTYIKCATEVGGDYYDFIEFEDGSLLVICGDATGHGTASGMMVSITKAGLLGIDSKDPNYIMKTLNKIIKKVDIGRLRMSLNLAHFQNGSIKLTSAAMPPIYHFEKKNNKVDEIQISNLPLGGLMTEDFTVLDKKFSKGDVIVMISDGLPEAPNKTGDLLDYEAVKNCVEKNSLKSAEEIKDELVKLSDNWLDGIHNPDDITIVVCKKLKD